MEETDENKLQDLVRKVSQLSERQQQLQKELLEIQRSIYDLKRDDSKKTAEAFVALSSPPQQSTPAEGVVHTAFPKLASSEPAEVTIPAVKPKQKEKAAIEDFIGSNLLNKVGIAVLVLGIAYGVKYSIDHDLINPLTRIILGYIAGGLLVFIAFRLKPKYETFSAVLVSGGMAAIYFITYAAYDFYHFFPQPVAFVLMVLFTAFTVFAALQYNMQVIAIIGLVGAYGVPFLLSDGSGRVVILFSYMAIINGGILVLAFRKYWLALTYVAFFLTWLIFFAWWFNSFDPAIHMASSLIFSTVYFLIFYATFLSYKLFRKEKFELSDIALMLTNSFVYYGFGYASISEMAHGELYLGWFTVFNGLLHFLVCFLIRKKKEEHKDIFYFVAALVIVFLTIAVPVQLEGKWVTLIWATEAALLFFIGRRHSIPTYEKLASPLVLLAVISLAQDCAQFYDFVPAHHHIFLLNEQFLTSFLVSGAIGFFLWQCASEKFATRPAGFMANTTILGALLTGVVYVSCYLEVQAYWDMRYAASAINVPSTPDQSEYMSMDFDLQKFKNIWLINYSAIFALVISIISLRFVNHKTFSFATLSFSFVVMAAFLLLGISCFASLRYSFLTQSEAVVFNRGIYHILIRYISILMILPLLWTTRKLVQREYFTQKVRDAEKTWLHFFMIVLLSSELIHWLDLQHIDNSDKIALSILWSLYALGMIVWGLSKQDKVVRMLGIILFGITLVKLFLYDISNMSTIAKTVVMMILGALLLVASFLYNRAKKKADEQE